MTPCFNAYLTIDLRNFITCVILFMRDTPLVKVCFDELTISQGYLAFYVSMCNTCIVILHAPDESCLSMYKISLESSVK